MGWREKKKQAKRPVVPLEPPVGTRDFYPDDLRRRAWLFAHFRAVAALFGFSEYDAPVLEHEVLYTRKGGEEITGQMYNFVDKGGYNVTRLWSTGFPLPQVGSILTMAILTMAIVLTMATLVVGRTYCVCALPIAAGGAPERACHRPRAG